MSSESKALQDAINAAAGEKLVTKAVVSSAAFGFDVNALVIFADGTRLAFEADVGPEAFDKIVNAAIDAWLAQ